jgi:hypothetical protein
VLGGEVGGPATRSRVTTSDVVVVMFALLSARFLCRRGFLFPVLSLLLSVGLWTEVQR